MRRTAVLFPLSATVLVATLAACSAGSQNNVSSQAAGTITASPAATAAGAASGSGGLLNTGGTQSAGQTSLDPCEIVTGPEAAALSGSAFGQGTPASAGNAGKACVYGSGTHNTVTVEVGQAQSAAAADAVWSAAQSGISTALKKELPSGIDVTVQTKDVTGLADRAALVTASATAAGEQLDETVMYLIKGTTFVSFGDLALGYPAPSTKAMVAEAQKALARVP